MTTDSGNYVLWGLIVALDGYGLWSAWRLFRRRDPECWSFLPEFGRWFALGAVLVIGSLLAGRVVLGSKFAFMRLSYHVLFLVITPAVLVRAVVLWRFRRRGPRRMALLLAVGGVAMMWTCVWATFVEPYRLEVTRHVVTSSRLAGLERPIRVVVLADLQTDAIGEYEREVFRVIDAERPDLLVLPGDYLQVRTRAVFEREREKLIELFDGLSHRPRLGMFGVGGDVDFAPDALVGTGVRQLDDEIVAVNDFLQVAGMRCATSRFPLPADLHRRIADFDGFTIVCGHAPEFMLPLIRGELSIDALFLAGHTHGGQVVVPGFGPPITLSGVPRQIAAGGLHEFGESKLCVSRGVGLERGYAPRIRLFCRPELVVFELRSAPE